MEADVPLLIPEVNADHLGLLKSQRAAIEAYDKSNQINTVLQQRLMEER